MEYKGKLYGKVGKSYFPLLDTSYDIDRMKTIIDNICFEPTLNGSVFKPQCGYEKLHKLLKEHYDRPSLKDGEKI